MSLRTFVVTVAGLVVLSAASSAQIKSVKEMSPAKAHAHNQPVAKKECERYAMALEEAVRARELETCEAAVDWNALYSRSTNGVPANDKTRREFREAAEANLRGPDGLMGGTIATVAAGGTFRFLRVVETGNGTHALFRLAHADGGVPDYLAFLVEGDEEGSALATDVDIAGEGGLLSLRLRRYFLALSAGTTRSLEDKVRGHDKLDVRYAKELEAAQDAFSAGENQKALDRLKLLPEEVKSDRAVVLLRLDAARAASDEAFLEALGDARRRFPSDTAVERRALDHFLLTNSFANARGTVRTLNAAVGGDPYLDWLLAGIEESAGDMAAARAACRRAIEREENFEDAWWTLLSYAIRDQRFAEAATILDRMESRFDIDWKALQAASAYQAFFASPEGRQMRARHEQRN